MRRKTKILIVALLVLCGIVTFFTLSFSLKGQVEQRITQMLEAKGLSRVSVVVSEMDTQHVLFSRIAFAKEKMEVQLEGLRITATSLPWVSLLRGDYRDLKGEWTLASVTVDGIPYVLPKLAAAGTFYTQENLPVVAGEFHDAAKQYTGQFSVNAKEVVLQDIHALWQEAQVSAQKVSVSLVEKTPVRIPLEIRKLPLSALLSLVSSDKATGTGMVSGHVEIVVHPDGRFDLGSGNFRTEEKGIIQLAADALPGDQPQMEIARKALANFHYKDLKLTTSKDSEGRIHIQLNVEGNNPDALEGRPVKLNVNLSGDVLELLQQTLLPMADPTQWLEKEHQ